MNYDVKDFEQEVIQLSSRIPVLVDFWAEWCGPCRILSPVLEMLAQKHIEEWELKKINTEQFTDIAARYQIRNIPNVKLFSEGSVINEFVGALPEASIEQWLRMALPDKHARQLDQAEVFVRGNRPEEAQSLIEPILTETPNHERGRALLALALLFSDHKRAVNLVADVDPSSKYYDMAETVRTFDQLLSKIDDPSSLHDSATKSKYLAAIKDVSQRRFDNALAQLIQIIRDDRYYDEDGSRKACIAIFKYLGEESEISMKHRREFGTALYV